ncbi:MAG TPA: thioesterase family protein [Noviherbaspirillum sp.]|nr:thioesterase family protein [Noviherbaspirillum sp.]
MNFNDAMSAVRESASNTITIPEAWGQGRATFGGMVAATMFERIIPHIAQDRPVRSVMVSFVAPVAPGETDVIVKVLREGKAATQIQATAYQNDQPCAVLLASFGGGRESAVTVAPGEAPAFKAPDAASAFPYIPGLTPEFTQHFDYRYTVGTIPFMGSDKTEMGGWIRLREGSGQSVTVPEILALLDAWPPAVLSMLKKPAMGSSLTWAVSFVNTPEDCSAGDWWQYLARIQSSAEGYSHIESTLWDKNGKVAVFSQQTVSVFG